MNKLTHQEFIDSIIGNVVAENENALEVKKQDVLTKVLDRAYDIRKFELELYWKRATYFWGFLIAIFTAYFIVVDPAKKICIHIQLLIICMGFLFSLAWYLVNRGSTYWVTNYERVIDAIEQYKGQSFYNLNLIKDDKSLFANKGYPFSVSRINIIVSLFIVCVWLGLLLNLVCINVSGAEHSLSNIDYRICLIIGGTILFAVLLLNTESKIKNDDYLFIKRESLYKHNI